MTAFPHLECLTAFALAAITTLLLTMLVRGMKSPPSEPIWGELLKRTLAARRAWPRAVYLTLTLLRAMRTGAYGFLLVWLGFVSFVLAAICGWGLEEVIRELTNTYCRIRPVCRGRP